MKHGIHFISGLPRSGSTLLSALLRQNPKLHAAMTSPVGSLFNTLLRTMSEGNESAAFLDNQHREAILRAVFDAYYARVAPKKTVFDTNRQWTTKLPALTALFPDCKVICCVRHVPWVVDSIESLIKRNKWEPSGIFNFDPGGTVYSRAEGVASQTGMVGFALNALREAVYGPQNDRLLLVQYESLTATPARTLAGIYDFLGMKHFRHDLKNVEYDEAESFDQRLGTPGLHNVGREVKSVQRRSILPPDLFARYETMSFWRDKRQMPLEIPVI